MASTEGVSNDSDRTRAGRAGETSHGFDGADAARTARELEAKTRAAVDRAGVGQQVRDTLSTPAGAGVLADAAAQVGPAHTATVATAVGNLAPAGVASAFDAMAARAGIATATAVGAVAGTAALAAVPTNTAPANVVEITPELRVSFPYDTPIGRIEAWVDGQWRNTGVEATMTAAGISADVTAIDQALGRPMHDAARGAFITERRNDLGLKPLDAISYAARSRLQIENRPGNWQAHHLVPFDVVNTLSPGLQRAIAASGWGMDDVGNLMALPRDWETYIANGRKLPMHNGAHPRYSSDVRSRLGPLEAHYQNISVEDLKGELDQISTDMRNLIDGYRYHITVR